MKKPTTHAEIEAHNALVCAVREARKGLPVTEKMLSDVRAHRPSPRWVVTDRRYDRDPRQGVLSWNTALMVASTGS